MDTVVFLHGFTGSADDWIEIAARVKQQPYNAQRISIIGHGETSSGSWEHLRDYDMQPVSMRLSIMTPSKFHLVGYSMGGRLALYFATRFPERLLSLTLISASPGLKTEAERAARRESDNALADKIEANGIEWFVDFWENLALWDTQSPELKANLRARRIKNSTVGLANSLRGMGTGVMPSLWDDLENLTIPTQLIVGEADTKFLAINREMAQKIPNVELHVMPDAGHACHLEKPRDFGRILNDFLGKQSSE